jgi:hypothetical protein
MPLSNFSPDVTLIAFPIPSLLPRGGRTSSLREALSFHVEEMVDIDVKANRTPASEFA